MALVIKKTVNLDSLGEEYSGVVLEFKSIPARDLPKLVTEQEALGEDTDKIIPYFIKVLEDYFILGKQGEESISKEDIGLLPSEALIHVFQILSGQAIDPKAENESTSISITETAQV